MKTYSEIYNLIRQRYFSSSSDNSRIKIENKSYEIGDDDYGTFILFKFNINSSMSYGRSDNTKSNTKNWLWMYRYTTIIKQPPVKISLKPSYLAKIKVYVRDVNSLNINENIILQHPDSKIKLLLENDEDTQSEEKIESYFEFENNKNKTKITCSCPDYYYRCMEINNVNDIEIENFNELKQLYQTNAINPTGKKNAQYHGCKHLRYGTSSNEFINYINEIFKNKDVIKQINAKIGEITNKSNIENVTIATNDTINNSVKKLEDIDYKTVDAHEENELSQDNKSLETEFEKLQRELGIELSSHSTKLDRIKQSLNKEVVDNNIVNDEKTEIINDLSLSITNRLKYNAKKSNTKLLNVIYMYCIDIINKNNTSIESLLSDLDTLSEQRKKIIDDLDKKVKETNKTTGKYKFGVKHLPKYTYNLIDNALLVRNLNQNKEDFDKNVDITKDLLKFDSFSVPIDIINKLKQCFELSNLEYNTQVMKYLVISNTNIDSKINNKSKSLKEIIDNAINKYKTLKLSTKQMYIDQNLVNPIIAAVNYYHNYVAPKMLTISNNYELFTYKHPIFDALYKLNISLDASQISLLKKEFIDDIDNKNNNIFEYLLHNKKIVKNDDIEIDNDIIVKSIQNLTKLNKQDSIYLNNLLAKYPDENDNVIINKLRNGYDIILDKQQLEKVKEIYQGNIDNKLSNYDDVVITNILKTRKTYNSILNIANKFKQQCNQFPSTDNKVIESIFNYLYNISKKQAKEIKQNNIEITKKNETTLQTKYTDVIFIVKYLNNISNDLYTTLFNDEKYNNTIWLIISNLILQNKNSSENFLKKIKDNYKTLTNKEILFNLHVNKDITLQQLELIINTVETIKNYQYNFDKLNKKVNTILMRASLDKDDKHLIKLLVNAKNGMQDIYYSKSPLNSLFTEVVEYIYKSSYYSLLRKLGNQIGIINKLSNKFDKLKTYSNVINWNEIIPNFEMKTENKEINKTFSINDDNEKSDETDIEPEDNKDPDDNIESEENNDGLKRLEYIESIIKDLKEKTNIDYSKVYKVNSKYNFLRIISSLFNLNETQENILNIINNSIDKAKNFINNKYELRIWFNLIGMVKPEDLIDLYKKLDFENETYIYVNKIIENNIDKDINKVLKLSTKLSSEGNLEEKKEALILFCDSNEFYNNIIFNNKIPKQKDDETDEKYKESLLNYKTHLSRFNTAVKWNKVVTNITLNNDNLLSRINNIIDTLNNKINELNVIIKNNEKLNISSEILNTNVKKIINKEKKRKEKELIKQKEKEESKSEINDYLKTVSVTNDTVKSYWESQYIYEYLTKDKLSMGNPNELNYLIYFIQNTDDNILTFLDKNTDNKVQQNIKNIDKDILKTILMNLKPLATWVSNIHKELKIDENMIQIILNNIDNNDITNKTLTNIYNNKNYDCSKYFKELYEINDDKIRTIANKYLKSINKSNNFISICGKIKKFMKELNPITNYDIIDIKDIIQQTSEIDNCGKIAKWYLNKKCANYINTLNLTELYNITNYIKTLSNNERIAMRSIPIVDYNSVILSRTISNEQMLDLINNVLLTDNILNNNIVDIMHYDNLYNNINEVSLDDFKNVMNFLCNNIENMEDSSKIMYRLKNDKLLNTTIILLNNINSSNDIFSKFINKWKTIIK